MKNLCFTIGHSTLTPEEFIALLQQHQIEVLVDVRAQPYSKFAAQFNYEPLKQLLKTNNIKYLYLGDVLGGPARNQDYILQDGSVDYLNRMKSENYLEGIIRLEKGISQFTVALMCAEKNPKDCHRHLLIAQTLVEDGYTVQHILSDGTLINAESIGFSMQLSLFQDS